MILFDTPITSTVIILTTVYFICESISTFETRIIQAKRDGRLPPDEPLLPDWTVAFIWIGWITFLALIFISWKYALAIFIIKFILKVLPVLETIGNILMSPFKPVKNEKI